MDKGKLNYDGLFNLEQPLLKVPAEQLKKAARISQRYVEYVMKEITTEVNKLSKPAHASSPEQATKSLDDMVVRLQKLKRKLEDTKAEEALYVERTKVRLNHLKELMTITSAESPAYLQWCQTRLDRMLVDYMLRHGYTETAAKVAADKGIEDLVDLQLFADSRLVEEALDNKNCSECLKWCNDNRSTLDKISSTLEFNLRLQEYIELARCGKKEEAIKYCRKYMIDWQDTHMKLIQQAMAMLAFGPDTQCEPYKELWDESRWDTIIEMFKSDNHALHNLTLQPLLTMTLQAGLAALKTPSCYSDENRTINCPVCAADTFGQLAQDLPCAHHVNSCIVDRLSGVIMDEHNPPMVLPNGYVYSSESLQALAAENHGMVRCERTGENYNIATARKAFIL
ncbi:CTLH/CRA C-terminal to lish motif domain-containing protein [Geranomyces variabilis]|nr:CTLH/CRA C-terminal to lish motif domain-containing protein [Geranomyces variabilis]KAJ3138854.1 GID complex subunit containing RING finger motif [Geranomyces variabilis]